MNNPRNHTLSLSLVYKILNNMLAIALRNRIEIAGSDSERQTGRNIIQGKYCIRISGN